MKINREDILVICLAFVLIVAGVFSGIKFSQVGNNTKDLQTSAVSGTYPQRTTASSTPFIVTTTSQRILATTTAGMRVSALINTVGCTPGSHVFLRAAKDAPATTSFGPVVSATSSPSEVFYDTMGKPVTGDSVQAITDAGTCTIVVTEWLYIPS